MWIEDEPWDEDRWEAFLRESDQRTSRYVELFHAFMNGQALPAWLFGDALDGEACAEEELHPAGGLEKDGFHRLPVYQQAFELASAVMEWSNTLPGEVKDSTLVQFCSSVMLVPAKLAKGHSFGYEQETIGGNIACVKRSLKAANTALRDLRELQGQPCLDARTYRRFYEQLFEVRNAVGLYVQELRARFDLGID